jgi:hypothetical protein
VMESASAVASARFAFEACCFLTGRAPVHVGSGTPKLQQSARRPRAPMAVAWATLQKCRLKASA